MMASLKDLNRNIKKNYDSACKQKVITDFFLSKKMIMKKTTDMHYV